MDNPILIYSASYFLFFLLLWLSKAKKGLRLFDDKGIVSNPGILIFLHTGGIIIFIVPLLFDHVHSSLLFPNDLTKSPSTWVTLLCFIIILLISPRIAERKYKKSTTNSFAEKLPKGNFTITYFTLRILFIGAYECWFRGFLLFDSINSLGILPAILLNVILYSLLHVVNGKDEVIACIPFGIVLCLLCIWQGTVWPAIVLHLALTIPYELTLLKKMALNNLNRHENFNNRSIWLPR